MRRRASLAGADEDEGLKVGMRSNVEEVDSDDNNHDDPPTLEARKALGEKESDNDLDSPTSAPAPAADTKMEDFYRKQRQRARLRSPWSCSLVTMICTGLSLLLLATIAQSFLSRQLDPKGCNMSYMLSAFAKYTDFDTEHTRFATKYSLYLYREAGIDQDTRVKGIPVLFIPGNAGSYKQVRSLAAEAANYYHDVLQHDPQAQQDGKRPFDFFSVDFNEDITAFHGQTLLDQAEYLNEAIAYILALYHNPHRSLRDESLPDPTSVMLVGHSMGGIVARTMFTMHNYQPNTINTIITLSAPHARAPVSFDQDIVDTYQNINDYWRNSYSIDQNPLDHVTLVSIVGGGLDTVVPSDYASLTSLVPESHGFTVFTSTMPHVWTGMDHLAIIWCDQLRKALIKALFDVADVKQPTQTIPREERMRHFRKRFLTGLESTVQKELPNQEAKMLLSLDDQSSAILSEGERLSLRQLGSSAKTEAHVLPVPSLAQNDARRLSVLTNQRIGEHGPLQVFLCSSHVPQAGAGGNAYAINLDLSGGSSGFMRLSCKDTAVDAIALPASNSNSNFAFDDVAPFTYIEYALKDLSDYQFVAVIDKASELTDGWVVAEFSDAVKSTVTVKRSLRSLMLSGMHRVLPATRAMVNEIRVPRVHSSLLAYTLRVHQKCNTEPLFQPLLRQYISEPYESKFFPNVRGDVNINLHGVSPFVPPPVNAAHTKDGLSLQIWSDPTCNAEMSVSLDIDFLGSFGKLYMRYRTVFAAFPLVVVTLVLRKQFKIYDATGLFISFTAMNDIANTISGIFMSFSESMDQCIRTSLPVLFIALSFLSLAFANHATTSVGEEILGHQHEATESFLEFTKNDLLLGSNDPFFFWLVPLFGVISVGVCIVLNYITLALTQVFTFCYAKVRNVRLRNDDGRLVVDGRCIEMIADFIWNRRTTTAFAVTSPLQRVITTSILLIMVATIIPYQFAYLVLCLVQLATSVRALRLAQETRSGNNYNFYNYVHSMLILMLWILPINLPVLVVWIHNLAVHWLTPFSSHHNILSIMPYILIVETMSTGHIIPRLQSPWRLVNNIMLFSLGLYAAVYGVSYAYVLHHLVNWSCAWLVIVHFAPVVMRRGALGEQQRGGGSSPPTPPGDGHVKKIP
ncbi:PGAP1-domain-containing protein [Aureobasidium sp. EXF-10727]|nr:PGAP1-domain-containing protein [Aureobasidium sp. EXF-10727]KAI4729680.1 PGAP1-domain-containing protein [Aureobasidium sp. EXF-10728]